MNNLGGVDKDTEFFNGYEWKKIENYNSNELVLQYNNDGSAELVKPIQYLKNPTSGFYFFDTSHLNMMLTPSQNLIYYSKRGHLNTKQCIDLINTNNNSKAGFEGRFISHFNFKHQGEQLDENIIKLKIAISADGSKNYQRNNTDINFNLKKERKVERLSNILDNLNIEYSYKLYDSGYHRFYFHFNDFTKDLKWIYSLDTKYYPMIAEEILQWDGSIDTQCRELYSYWSTIKGNADVAQFVWNSIDYNSYIHDDIREDRNTCYSVYRSKSIGGFHRLCGHRNRNKFDFIPVNELSYNFIVPSNKLVLRRNNLVFITGGYNNI